MDVYCYAEAVPYTNSTAFGNSPINEATLHVPQASIIAYKAKKPWSDFGKIVALSDGNLPATGDGGADFGTDIDNGTNLNGNVIGNIYYNIGSGDGGYNAAEGCIVVVSWQGNGNGIDAVNEIWPQDDALYNLKGQRVTTPQPDQIYIRNRKKVFFK